MSRRFRVIDGKVQEVTHSAVPTGDGIPPPAVSDSLGFPEQCLADRQKQLQGLGCQGIEFKRDPSCPEFIQVHGSSRSALDRYTKLRGLDNRTGSLGGKQFLTEDDFAKARELINR